MLPSSRSARWAAVASSSSLDHIGFAERYRRNVEFRVQSGNTFLRVGSAPGGGRRWGRLVDKDGRKQSRNGRRLPQLCLDPGGSSWIPVRLPFGLRAGSTKPETPVPGVCTVTGSVAARWRSPYTAWEPSPNSLYNLPSDSTSAGETCPSALATSTRNLAIACLLGCR